MAWADRILGLFGNSKRVNSKLRRNRRKKMPIVQDKTRHLIVTADNAVYDFDTIESADGSISEAELKRSALHHGWTNPGSLAIKLTDNDNEVIIKVEGKKPIKLAYHEACELFVVLNEYMKAGSKLMRCDYEKFVKEDA